MRGSKNTCIKDGAKSPLPLVNTFSVSCLGMGLCSGNWKQFRIAIGWEENPDKTPVVFGGKAILIGDVSLAAGLCPLKYACQPIPLLILPAKIVVCLFS